MRLEQETAAGNLAHAEWLAGRRVIDFDPAEGLAKVSDDVAYAVRLPLDRRETDVYTYLEVLHNLLYDPRIHELRGLVLGWWGHVNEYPIYEALVDAKNLLTGLDSLFVADHVDEERMVSWIELCNWGLLLELPALTHLRVRGNGLPPRPLASQSLRSLCVQTGGLPRPTATAVASADLPCLEHLELWIGSDAEYGGSTTPSDLNSVLSGKQFPALRHLGLRNAQAADRFAHALATAPVLAQLDVLDLSLGTLGDEGAHALLANPALSKLKRLDLQRNYLSAETCARFAALEVECNLGEQRHPRPNGRRYISLSE